MSEGIFEKRFLLKERQWKKVAADLRSVAPIRDLKVSLLRRSDPHSSPVIEIDAALEALELRPLGEKWAELNEATVGALLARMIGYRLMGGEALLSPIEIETTADHLIETFRAHPHYYTNVIAFDEVGIANWTPVSDSHFDAVVACADNDFVGVIAVLE